ncbi:hypothetical protein DSO57_1036392 [Entomophthora muscae]|uniref:Uncharacterized protein n=1 Tax=Entomophthora muscae TaxID=34485 RepID=A0ACC2SZD2_9FUNG|nr:hypothetical protein DSO57_1036392 [Entomophthora muscae]
MYRTAVNAQAGRNHLQAQGSSQLRPPTKSTFFIKAIQDAAKHKYKASEIKQQLELIATALL